MIEGQKLGPFTVTNHFFERWFERTELPSNYFECIIEENLYILIDTKLDVKQEQTEHYMFYSAHLTKYFMFVVVKGMIKTILTEKMYKEFYDIHLDRAKKELKILFKAIKERYSIVQYSINNVIVHSNKVEFTQDPLWERIHSFNNFFAVHSKKLMNNTELYKLLLLPWVPVEKISRFEILVDSRPIKYYTKELTIYEMTQIRVAKTTGTMNMPQFHGRKQTNTKKKSK